MDKERREAIISQFGLHQSDTGSSATQVALLTQRISQLSEHLKSYPKDHHSQRGLFKLIGKRRRLLAYLSRCDVKRYANLIAKLGLRK